MILTVTVISLLIAVLILSCTACGMGPDKPNDSKGSVQVLSSPSGNSATETAGTGSAGKTIEPSVLISQEQAEKLVGDKVAKSEENDLKPQGIKQYIYEFSNQSMQISIYQESTVQFDITPEQMYNIYTEKAKSSGGIKVDGMADETYVYSPYIYIWDKGYFIYIQMIVNPKDNDKQADILKQAGQIAVAGLENALK